MANLGYFAGGVTHYKLFLGYIKDISNAMRVAEKSDG